jgi:RHS repeat-associated protein
MILARENAEGDVAWYLTDHLGTVRDIADPSGTVLDHIAYCSFGGILSESNPSSGNRFKYTGRELDPNGLYYYRARYYDAAIARFVSEDPIRFYGGDANLQSYVGNSPTNFIDPSGLDWTDASGGSHTGSPPSNFVQTNGRWDAPVPPGGFPTHPRPRLQPRTALDDWWYYLWHPARWTRIYRQPTA